MSSFRPLTVLVEPNTSEAEEVAREAISHHRTLLIVGKCSVDYAGRAKSKLELGERILIVKADGSLLVHRSTGYEPVNWMPGTNVIFHVQSKGQALEIRAVRQKPSESLRVSFDNIRLVTELSLVDAAEFSLYSSEEDMQKAVLLKPELLEEGFKIISWEKKVEPGFIDVYGTDKNGRLVVVEIKRKTAGKDAVLQLARYMEAIKSKADRQVRGILASPDIAKDVQRLLATSGLEFKHLDPRKCAETLRRAEKKELAEYFKENKN
ncbi:MAG TPA: endonuclease NucS [candidate division Zixibacteria bacterium]|nr:endonuclease NucS [candidate division Zixibacteria bacterium]